MACRKSGKASKKKIISEKKKNKAANNGKIMKIMA